MKRESERKTTKSCPVAGTITMWLNGFNESMNDRCINSSLFDHRMLWMYAKIKWRAITHYFNIFTYLFSTLARLIRTTWLSVAQQLLGLVRTSTNYTHTHTHGSNDWNRPGCIRHILPFGHIMLFTALFDAQWRHDFYTNHSFVFAILFLCVVSQLLSNRKSIGTKIKPENYNVHARPPAIILLW